MSTNDVVSVEYRAVDEEGHILAEGTDAEEVAAMGIGQPFTLLVKTERRVISDWNAMSEKDLKFLLKGMSL